MSESLLLGLGVALLLAGTGLATVGLRGRRWPAGAARWGIGSGGYLLLLALVARGLAVRGLPLSSAYEASLLTAALVAVFYALATPETLSGGRRPCATNGPAVRKGVIGTTSKAAPGMAGVNGAPATAPGRAGGRQPSGETPYAVRRPAALGGLCAGTCALAVLALAALVFPVGARAAQPPPAALSGVWFPLHVGATAAGYGGLLLAGSAGLLRLLRPRLAQAGLDALLFRGLAWGYPLLTLGMTLGAVWGWTTWGRYWSWSVKEVLTLSAWGLFTLALHTRRLRGWDGWVHSAILAAGLAAVLVTLLGAEAVVRWFGMGMEYVF